MAVLKAAPAHRPGRAVGWVDDVVVGGAAPANEPRHPGGSVISMPPCIFCTDNRSSKKDAKLAQKLGQLQPFIAVFPQECMANLHLLGQPNTFLASGKYRGPRANGSAAGGETSPSDGLWNVRP
jgi:hypothetical protein